MRVLKGCSSVPGVSGASTPTSSSINTIKYQRLNFRNKKKNEFRFKNISRGGNKPVLTVSEIAGLAAEEASIFASSAMAQDSNFLPFFQSKKACMAVESARKWPL